MTAFQHVAVLDAFGPHVTSMAGVELAGRYWATTAGTAAKVRAVRAGSSAAVLAEHDGGWTLSSGPVTVLDPRRPLASLADPVAVGLVGPALARLGIAHADQIAGYVRDGSAVPAGWRPTDRVLLVVQIAQRLQWTAAGVGEATGRFATRGRLPAATRRRRQSVAPAILDGLSAEARRLVEDDRRCTVGLSGASGPVVVSGWWDRRGTASVDADALGHLDAVLPGPCAVTLDGDDDHDQARPSAKRGVMLRGEAAVIHRVTSDPHRVELAIRVARTTAWSGFEISGTSLPGSRRAS